MKQAEISVLNGLYKNAAVGKDAIFCVLEHTQDADLRKELCTQLDYYETQQQKIRQQMKTFYQYPKELGTLAKVCSSASIRLHCLGGTDSHQVAKLMVEGTNMGLIQLSQLMNRHANLTDSVRKPRGRNDAAGRSVLESAQALSLRRNRYGIWKTTADTHRCSGKNLSATGKIRGGSATDWLFRPCSSSYL